MFIYEITNTKNGKKYVGQTLEHNPNRRWRNHKCDLNNNRHCNPHLQLAWNKYGKTSFKFETVDGANTLEELNSKEDNRVKMYSKEMTYNIRPGGNNYLMSDETKHKISKTKLGHHKIASENKRENMSLVQRKIEYPLLIDPTGKVVEVKNVRGLARQYGIDQTGLRFVINGKYQNYKGWCRKEDGQVLSRGDLISRKRKKNQYFDVISPIGDIYSIENLSSFCRKHGLSKGLMSMLVRGKIPQYKNWTYLEKQYE